jgi:hypothetical protein
MKITSLITLFSAALLWTACSESKPEVKETKNEQPPKEVTVEDDGRGGEFEDYMALVDISDSLIKANTLYYAKPSGEAYQVYLKLDDESNLVRMEEQYTKSGNGSILRTFYYYRDGDKIATREIFNEGIGEAEMFNERVSYYDEDQKPIISKVRTTRFEEYLQNETFRIIDPVDCSDERAKQALARDGEFSTNFVGVISQEQINYIIVGEGVEGGFTTSLVVQQLTPLVTQLLSSPDSFKGEPMDIEFQEVPDGQGFTFQSLISLKRSEK